MDIVKYIINFLKEKEFIVIPGLGSFTLNYVSASIHPVEHVFAPPAKTLVFESIAAQNDSFIIYIAKHENINKALAIDKIRLFTDSIFENIQREKCCKIEGLGVFELNDEKIIIFKAEKALFEDEFTGFTAFSSAAIARTEFKDKAAQIALNEKEKIAKRKKRRKILIIVFSILFLAASSALLYIYSDFIKGYLIKENVNPLPVISKQDSADIKIQTDTVNLLQKDTAQVQLAEDTSQKLNNAATAGNYYIVAASFKSEENANKSVKKLKVKGFNGAGITRQEGNSMFIVYYQSYSTKEEAYKVLQQIIKTENAESWLLKN